jgi:tripartite-type tricarboxylate transporter receptor subunit TctC
VDLIKLARAEPGKITYGSSGNGSTNHLVMAEFAAINHLQLMHVPYKGSAASVTDLLGGQIATLVESVAVVSPYLKSDKIRILGMTGIKRSPLMPDVPTLNEQGITGFDFGTWTGLVAPKGTPVAVLDRLNSEVGKILQSADVRKMIEGIGMLPIGGPRRQFADYVASESKKWGKVVKTTETHLE